MYHLSMLSKPTMEFVNRVGASAGSRAPVFAIAAAYAVANTLALPAMAIDDITAHYRLQCDAEVRSMLDQLNEIVPFNAREARDVAKAFYSFRYRSANPKLIPLAFNPETAIEDFFGLSSFFSKETLGTIRSNPEALTQFVNGLVMLFNELREAKTNAAAQQAAQAGKEEYVAPLWTER